MRRLELAIAVLVLVPFAVLVVAGFRALDAPGSTPRTAAADPRPAAPAELSARLDAGLAVRASAPVVAPSAAPGIRYPAAIDAPLRAVAPEVHRCLADVRHPRAADDVTVRFRPTPDGGFTQITVESSSDDPFLIACVTDAFEELTFTPTGAEDYQPAVHTFHEPSRVAQPPAQRPEPPR